MKRVIALIVSAALLLCGTVFAEDSKEQEDTYYNEAARAVEALDITDGTDNGSESVTRLDVLKSVVKIMTRNADYNVSGAELPFVDVPSAENWSVSYAFATGLITADSIYFRPSDDADYSFAETLMLKAMTLYNYPNINSSQKAELIRKLHLSDGGFTKGDMCVMLYNMLCADDMNMLYGAYDVKIAKAFVMANDSEAYEGNVCKEGYVRLEINKSKTELNLKYEQDSSELLGRMVKVFYDTDDNAVLMIESKDDIIAEIDNSAFLYYDAAARELRWIKGRHGSLWNESISEGKLDLPKDMDIVFNERFTTRHSAVYDILENGGGYNIDKITIFDRDGDGKADLMKVSAYKTVLVESVDSARMIVKVQNTENIVDFKDEQPEPELKISDTKQNTVKFSDIKKNSVLSLFYKLDNAQGETETLKIIVSTDTVLGSVSSKSKNADGYTVIVSGTQYILANGAENLADRINVGKSYKLYADHNGKIAGAEMITASGTNIGAVVNVGTEGGLDTTLIFKMYSADGEMFRLNGAKNFKVDGAKVTFQNGSPVYTAADGTKTYLKDALYGSVVRYSINGDGELSSVELPKMGAEDGEFGYTAGINDVKDIMTNASRYKLIYKTSGRYFFPGWSTNKAMNFVGIDNSTRVLKIPAGGISENREEYFQKGSLTDFSNDKTYAIIGFNANGGSKTVADVVAVVTDVSVDFTNAQYYVVKDICGAVNKSDSVGYELTLVNKNGTESKITTADTVFPEFDNTAKQYTGNNVEIEKGDVIRYSLNSYGDANAFIVDYDCSKGTAKEEKADSFYETSRLVFASVYKANGSVFAYTRDKTITDESEIWLGSATKVITVEVKPRDIVEVTSGTPDTMIGYTNDKTRYSYIVYATKNGECNIVVEYRR